MLHLKKHHIDYIYPPKLLANLTDYLRCFNYVEIPPVWVSLASGFHWLSLCASGPQKADVFPAMQVFPHVSTSGLQEPEKPVNHF